MNYLFSLILSTALGFLLLDLLSIRRPLDLLQKAILSVTIGLGISGQIVFYSLMINQQYSAALIWGLHAGILTALVLRRVWLYRKDPRPFQFRLERPALIGLGALFFLLIPLWREAHFFPFGGWDAWSCWNLKARFIFLGGENWQNMLDPALWRTNNHYPFLLPLINVWGWSFYGDATVLVPMFNAIAFSFLTALLLFASLYRLTGHRWACIPALIFFLIPFVIKLSISQYSDIVVAFFLLAALCALVQARLEDHQAWAVVAGLCVGFMGFTKTEGLVASVIMITLAFPLFLNGMTKKPLLLKSFLTAALIASLPTIIFKLALSPDNVAFTNGLTSTQAPSDLFRLQATFMFLCMELISAKWNGLWILLLCGLLIAGLKSFHQGRWIVPATLGIFLAVAVGYYYINTYFEILWWLKVSLNRILYTLLPAFIWWVFYSLWASPTKK
jgi:hypothetical protein